MFRKARKQTQQNHEEKRVLFVPSNHPVFPTSDIIQQIVLDVMKCIKAS